MALYAHSLELSGKWSVVFKNWKSEQVREQLLQKGEGVTLMNKVVVHSAGGEIIKGYTGDFSRHKPSFLFSSEDGTIRINQTVQLKDLKAIFFVKSFDGNFLHKTRLYFENDLSYGKKVIVTFKDGEEFIGRVETMHSDPDDSGFFIFPLDPDSNTIRAFFLNSSIVGIQDYN
ncbi:MAG: hypothetical protein KAR40_05055 [Candidatus Sabulitectum sp.]|nr:hypothetical protein [Candidatus Sabulitectum sp.]